MNSPAKTRFHVQSETGRREHQNYSYCHLMIPQVKAMMECLLRQVDMRVVHHASCSGCAHYVSGNLVYHDLSYHPICSHCYVEHFSVDYQSVEGFPLVAECDLMRQLLQNSDPQQPQ